MVFWCFFTSWRWVLLFFWSHIGPTKKKRFFSFLQGKIVPLIVICLALYVTKKKRKNTWFSFSLICLLPLHLSERCWPPPLPQKRKICFFWGRLHQKKIELFFLTKFCLLTKAKMYIFLWGYWPLQNHMVTFFFFQKIRCFNFFFLLVPVLSWKWRCKFKNYSKENSMWKVSFLFLYW